MKSIAIFGGTFDPVHQGHIEVAKAAKQFVDIDQVLFMPCWQSPFKGAAIASGAQRYEMLQLAIQDEGIDSWATVSEFEINRPNRSYSWQTVQHFRVQMPEVNWYWIVGTDQWQVIEDWAESEKLRKWLSFIVLTRGGAKVEPQDGWSHKSVEFDHPASASKIRSDYDAYAKGWLSENVYNYCFNNNLYKN